MRAKVERSVDTNKRERSSKLLLHLIACCCVVSTRMANGQVSCPVDSTPLEFGGYSDKHKCVSFVPKDRIPKCGRLLHECLEQFCATEFSGGHLMNWDPNDIADIPQTFCGLGCPPVEHCSWYTNPLHYHFGGWYDYLFISDFLKDMRMQKEQKRLSWVKLPACRNLILYRDRKETPKIYGLYECQEANFDYFACQHKKYPACSMKKEKNCHYSPEHNECRLWKYTIVVPPSKYGIPCEKQSEEKCECPCSGEPQEWQPWSATCGVMTRSRVRPKNPGRADCKQLPEACCTEEETKVGEDCKNYAYNTGINLRTTGCVNGTKGVDANDHLECVCDPGFTGVLCDIVYCFIEQACRSLHRHNVKTNEVQFRAVLKSFLIDFKLQQSVSAKE
ncbi:hypothetical protein D918_03683 [Trichuris suis]|nr:hypothetical protein D918_03683 [Trichuris suis]